MFVTRLLAFTLATACATAAAAQPPLSVYPAKGQTASLQSKDKQACDRWAVEQTGFDPALASPPPQAKGGVAKGALAGAAVGGLAGSLGGEAGEGAAVGAVAGGVIGNARQRRRNNAAAATQQANHQGYNNAFAACMTGRGYTVR